MSHREDSRTGESSVRIDDLKRWMRQATLMLDRERERLSGLDSMVGDGDHGAAVTRAFSAVAEREDDVSSNDLGAYFREISSILTHEAGGAFGSLIGEFFLGIASETEGEVETGQAGLAGAFANGLRRLQSASGAVVGDKTMVDALVPAIDAMRQANDLGQAVCEAADKAEEGAEATKSMTARHGRARFLGERSTGIRDPGATTVAVLFRALQRALVGEPSGSEASGDGVVNGEKHIVEATPFPRRFVSSTDGVVADVVKGFVSCYSALVEAREEEIVVRKHPKPPGHVGLVIGNGSGHEPANIGYVGHGLLDVNVCGRFFAAPSGESLARGIRLADRGAGVILFVPNHSGDVLSTQMAERQLADDDIEVATVRLTDDISTAPRGEEDQRRARGGALFAFKIAGALAEQSDVGLADVAQMADMVARRTRTLGATIAPRTDFRSGKPVYEIPAGMVELGTGSHGETSGELVAYEGPESLARLVTERLLSEAPSTETDELLVLISGTGATPLMELYILAESVHGCLSENSMRAVDTRVGEYVTTQDMVGFFMSFCWLERRMKELWFRPCLAAHFRQTGFEGGSTMS